MCLLISIAKNRITEEVRRLKICHRTDFEIIRKEKDNWKNKFNYQVPLYFESNKERTNCHDFKLALFSFIISNQNMILYAKSL